MSTCERCCTSTSRGRRRQRWLVTPAPPMMFQVTSASRAGRGTDFKPKIPWPTDALRALWKRAIGKFDHSGSINLRDPQTTDLTPFEEDRPITGVFRYSESALKLST